MKLGTTLLKRLDSRQRDIKCTQHPRRFEYKIGFALELTDEAVLNQSRPETSLAWRTNRRPAALGPSKSKLLLHIINGGGDFHSTSGNR